LVKATLLSASLAAFIAAGSAQAETCRQALALGLDVSGSVDAREWQLQIEGLARALASPEVTRAFLAVEGAPVWITIYEWAGDASPRDLVPWVAIRSQDDLQDVQRKLRSLTRVPHGPGTAMGEGIRFGGARLSERPGCWRYTLDISADGRSNMGPRPERVRFEPNLSDVTINGLIVSTGSDTADAAAVTRELDGLERYFRGAVIKGYGAFVERAGSYHDYDRAMTRKLLKELQTLTIGWLDILPDQNGQN